MSTPRQVDIVWNKQDLAMILYHAISIYLLLCHRQHGKKRHFQILTKIIDRTNTSLADSKSTFLLAVFGCDQYSSRALFCFFAHLFSSPGMDAWTRQRGHMIFSLVESKLI